MIIVTKHILYMCYISISPCHSKSNKRKESMNSARLLFQKLIKTIISWTSSSPYSAWVSCCPNKCGVKYSIPFRQRCFPSFFLLFPRCFDSRAKRSRRRRRRGAPTRGLCIPRPPGAQLRLAPTWHSEFDHFKTKNMKVWQTHNEEKILPSSRIDAP